jgi:peptidoglycan/xylan/chitin deacetylase (PgdA/CDA1 family)
MRIRGAQAVRRGVRCLVRGFQARTTLLLYHRIATPSVDAHRLCVTPEHFGEHLETLRRRYRILRLSDLWRSLATGRVPRNAVVLTFDDGYADNLYQARPYLARYDAPATVFVTAGQIGQEREFWWDELQRLILTAPSLPDNLEVKAALGAWRLALGGDGTCCVPEGPAFAGPSAKRQAPGAGAERSELYWQLYSLLRPLMDADRELVLAQLRSQIPTRAERDVACRAMSAAEVCRLCEGGLVDVGAHTMTHPVLAALPPERQAQELRGSKAVLGEILGRPVATLSYPYGGEAEVGAAAPQLAREAGFEVACAVAHRAVTRGEDRYRLPRMVVEDWDGDELARRLRALG